MTWERGVSREELERMKNRFRPYADVRPRPSMMRLIVALDLAYKRIDELEKENSE